MGIKDDWISNRLPIIPQNGQTNGVTTTWTVHPRSRLRLRRTERLVIDELMMSTSVGITDLEISSLSHECMFVSRLSPEFEVKATLIFSKTNSFG